MEKRRIDAAIAGLLHDIGKLEQRARVDPWNPAPGVEGTMGPVHATWTAYFCQNYLPKRFQGPALAGAYHHRPDASPAQDQSLSRLVALADKLSAGERSDPTADYPQKQPPQQMISIFDMVALAGKPRQDGFHYLPLAKLALKDRVIFPSPVEAANDQAAAYDDLRQDFEQAARDDPGDDQAYLENLLSALQRTAWCVPSAYYHSLPDVSLYDHSRMTAALAVCLSEKPAGEIQNLLEAVAQDYRRKIDDKIPAEGQALLETPVALLIGGDISGVQKFIYTLSSKGAAKTLRGRSFYLQLLTEAVMRYVMRQLEIPATNVIYSGGGHFYLLAPISAKGKLGQVQEYVTAMLLKYHGISLYLALGCVEIPASGFGKGKFPDYWDRMHAELVIAKQQRYTELGDDLYVKVIKPKPHGGNQENTCAVCGEERGKSYPLEEGEAGAKICSFCASFADSIGKHLPHCGFVGLGFGQPQAGSGETAMDVLRAFGLEVAWGRKNTDPIQFENPVERVVIWSLDDADTFPEVLGAPAAKVNRFTVNLVPQMRFDELQEKAEGIKRLGVLRMDVDDLGLIFKRGFGAEGNNQATLARLSTLSFQVSLFFEGWIKVLCKRFGDLIYAVYAGGDDVFLIGPWHIMPQLAQMISSELARYTSNNPDIHISGGLAFIHGKYPVYQAAEDAGEAESQAKSEPGKNAFFFLGKAWKWDVFAQVRSDYELVKKIVSREDVGGLGGPQSLIQRLRQLASNESQARVWVEAEDRVLYGQWIWQGVYYLTRMEEMGRKGKPHVADAIRSIKTSLENDDFQNISRWGTAARWAQLELRK